MRRVIWVMLLAVVSNSAAAVWVKVSEDANMVIYADPEVIREADNRVKLWWVIDFKTVQTNDDEVEVYLSSRKQYEFNCKEERYSSLSFSKHSEKMVKGNVVYSSSKIGEWRGVPPNTNGKLLLKFACGKAY